jgi:ABC-type xylose transport system permease subunit
MAENVGNVIGAPPVGGTQGGGKGRGRSAPLLDLDSGAMLLILLGLWGLLALLPQTRDVFLTQRNLANLMTQVSPLAIVAVGMTLVILIRGIDLSVGAGVALTGVIAAILQLDHGQPAWVAIGAALAVGAVMGLWQGVLVARFGLPAFVVSLAGFYAFRGLALVLSGSRGLAPMRDDFAILVDRLPPTATVGLILVGAAGGVALLISQAQRRRALDLPPLPALALAVRAAATLALAAFLIFLFGGRGLPVPVLLAGAAVLAGVVITRRTRFGRHLYAIGGNPEAARLSGIAITRATVSVYVLIGVLTALAGLVLCARTNGVTPGNAGNLFELDVVTAVVIGGTSLLGGRGSVVGSLLGALVFGTLANAMNLLEVDSNWQLILKGLILMTAVLVDVVSKRRR